MDAVAFDPDPITGGKIVIQAKRYTRTVGVAAVRDLYGTMQHEQASRGILVTTADYGPDAHKFSSGKPITLMTGGNLLHLLGRHGIKAKIDLREARRALTCEILDSRSQAARDYNFKISKFDRHRFAKSWQRARRRKRSQHWNVSRRPLPDAEEDPGTEGEPVIAVRPASYNLVHAAFFFDERTQASMKATPSTPSCTVG